MPGWVGACAAAVPRGRSLVRVSAVTRRQLVLSRLGTWLYGFSGVPLAKRGLFGQLGSRIVSVPQQAGKGRETESPLERAWRGEARWDFGLRSSQVKSHTRPSRGSVDTARGAVCSPRKQAGEAGPGSPCRRLLVEWPHSQGHGVRTDKPGRSPRKKSRYLVTRDGTFAHAVLWRALRSDHTQTRTETSYAAPARTPSAQRGPGLPLPASSISPTTDPCSLSGQ